jgi:hypothetical protein
LPTRATKWSMRLRTTQIHFDYELVLNLLHVIERSAQPPAAPVERSAPAAPTGDTRSGERPPASAAMGHSAGADTQCSADTGEEQGLRARGVGRMFDNEKAILVIFDRKLTDDELRSLHEQIRILP